MIARRRTIREMDVEGLADIPGVSFLERDERDTQDRGDDEDNFWLTCIVLDPAVTSVSPPQLRPS